MTGYLKQLQRARALTEQHLDEEMRPECIARHTGMSMWHFQRIFSGALGQPVMDDVCRRRLCSGGHDFICNITPIEMQFGEFAMHIMTKGVHDSGVL